MFIYGDGEYYVVKFNDGTYYKEAGILFLDKRTTNDLKETKLYTSEWQIQKDLYLQQFLYSKDLKCEYVRVKAKISVEIIND